MLIVWALPDETCTQVYTFGSSNDTLWVAQKIGRVTLWFFLLITTHSLNFRDPVQVFFNIYSKGIYRRRHVYNFFSKFRLPIARLTFGQFNRDLSNDWLLVNGTVGKLLLTSGLKSLVSVFWQKSSHTVRIQRHSKEEPPMASLTKNTYTLLMRKRLNSQGLEMQNTLRHQGKETSNHLSMVAASIRYHATRILYTLLPFNTDPALLACPGRWKIFEVITSTYNTERFVRPNR